MPIKQSVGKTIEITERTEKNPFKISAISVRSVVKHTL